VATYGAGLRYQTFSNQPVLLEVARPAEEISQGPRQVVVLLARDDVAAVRRGRVRFALRTKRHCVGQSAKKRHLLSDNDGWQVATTSVKWHTRVAGSNNERQVVTTGGM